MRCQATQNPSTRSSACSNATRRNSGKSASRWRQARIPPSRKRLGIGFRGRHMSCRKSAWSRMRPLSWPWPAGVDAEETMQPGIEPRLRAGESAFGPLWESVRDRRPVTFDYRAAGRSEAQRRHLEPWGVVNRHGRWYVAGHDTGSEAARVLRLSRIEGQVE